MDREELLLYQVKHGDGKAFETFVEHFWKPVFHLAYRFTGSSQDAEDVCQEVFLRVHRNAATFRGEGKAFTWLYRIATNVCLNWKRKHRPTVPLEEESARGITRDNVMSLEIRDAFAGLSKDDRILLIYRKFYGFSYEEMGKILDLPVTKIKSRLHDAKTRLAKKLGPFLEEGGEDGWTAQKSNPG